MCNFVKKHLHGDIYQKDEIMKLLETTPTELESTSLTANTTRMDTFKLYQRAMHVYEGKCLFTLIITQVFGSKILILQRLNIKFTFAFLHF